MLKVLLEDKLIDYIAMDIKTSPEKDSYEKVTGSAVEVNKIKQSIGIIMESGLEYEFRTTIVPGLHVKEDILKIVEFIKGAKRYYLQQFRAGEKILAPEFRETKAYPAEFLQELREKIKYNFEICEVRE
jgi:pyruvate formate lyase activating enzyme